MFDPLNTTCCYATGWYGLVAASDIGFNKYSPKTFNLAAACYTPSTRSLWVVAAGRSCLIVTFFRRSGCGTAALFTIGGNVTALQCRPFCSRDQRQITAVKRRTKTN